MRIVGCDPGSGHFARTTLDIETPSRRARYITHEVYDVGHMVPLAKPRRRKDGKTQTDERVVSAEDIEQLACSLRGYLETARVNHPGIVFAYERRARVFPSKGHMVSAELASQLKTAEGLGMMAAGIAWMLGYRMMPVSPEEWRKSVAGDIHADDKAVGVAIPLCVADWPARSNPHARDAAGVAAFAGRKAIVDATSNPLWP